MAFPENGNYTLGKGRLYFDQFALGTKTKQGERYLGNTPEFNLTSESEELEHFSSDAGVRVKDDSVLLELTRSGTFITDHISPDNLALFFLGSAGVLSQASATGVVSNLAAVKQGLYYQLGTSPTQVEGVRNVASVVVTDDATPTPNTYDLNDDYTLDAVSGRIQIVNGGAIVDGTNLVVTFNVTATSINRVITAGNAEIYGALRFIATNPKGEKFDYYFPYVSIRPNGDFAIKGDEWQQLSFNLEVLKLDDNTESMYVTNID
jgi:hypothetical protein